MNSRRVDRYVPLDLHFDGRAYVQLYLWTVLQQCPCHTARNSCQPAVSCPVYSSSGQTTDASHATPDGCAFGRIFDPLASVFILLDRSFLVFYAFIVSPRRVLDVSRKHHGVTGRINHRCEMNEQFRTLFRTARPRESKCVRSARRET